MGEVTELAFILRGRMTSGYVTVSSADPIGPLEVSSANLIGSLSPSAQQDPASVRTGDLLASERGAPRAHGT